MKTKMLKILMLIFAMILILSALLSCVKEPPSSVGTKDDKEGNERNILNVEIIDGYLWVTYSDAPDSPINVGKICEENTPHTFGEWKIHNTFETDCEKQLYYRVCSHCNGIEWKEGTYKDHSWNTVTTPPTCQAGGYDTKTCVTCGKVEVCNATSPADHKYATKYTTDYSFHWKSCITCGYCTAKEEHVLNEEKCIICDKAIVLVEGYDGSAVTITFSHTMGKNLATVLDRYIGKFNEIYPNITIKHSQIGGYDEVRDQTNKQLTAGNQPNIAFCTPDHVALYNATDKVIPLNNLIESTIEIKDEEGNVIEILGLTAEQKADFIQAYYNEGAIYDEKGTMYTMPLSKSVEMLFYNKTFFDQHGLTVPTTWEEMERVCAQIKQILATDSNPNNDADIPLGYDSEANWFITMCEQYGSDYTSATGNHYLFDNDTNKSFIKTFRDWYQAGFVTTQELYGTYISKLFTQTDPTKPTCYMCIGSTGGASHQIPIGEDDSFPFEVGVAAIPQVNPENPKAISQGPSLCIFSQAGDKDDYDNNQEVLASWLFVKYLCTTPEFQASFSMTSGYMPVIQSAIDIPQYTRWLNNANSTGGLVATVAKLAFEQADSAFVSPAFNGSTKARDQVGALLQYCFVIPTDDVDAMINKAFKDAIAECNNHP